MNKLSTNKPSTMQIVDSVSNAIITHIPNVMPYQNNFKEWLIEIEKHQLLLQNVLNPTIAEYLPLKNEVWKLVIKKLYNVMPFSKEYILKIYRHTHKNIPYLLYPAKQPKYLIILFTGYINYESYNRFSWYFDETEQSNNDTAYLFLGDQSLHWYVGTPEMPTLLTYCEIINNTLETLNISHQSTFAVGASMGGYASILFGTICKLGGVIAVHPQLCKKSADRYHRDNWKRKINECGMNFINLDDLIMRHETIPPIYLEVGRNPADTAGLKNFTSAVNKKNSLLILRRHDSYLHETKKTFSKYNKQYNFSFSKRKTGISL